jgi:hypothetical protein
MRGIARLIFVTGVAVVAFVVALLSFRQVPASECQMDAVSDPAYQAQLEEQPKVNLTTYHVLVTHDDVPVQGAQVCMRADMGGPGRMPGMGTSNLGREVAPGRYEVPVRLIMGGPWQVTVIASERARIPVAMSLLIEVT